MISTTGPSDDVLVVVLSRNYSTGLSVIRSLGSVGYKIDLVANAHKEGLSAIAASSKYVRHAEEVISAKLETDIDEDEANPLIGALLKYREAPEKQRVLFPVDDYTVSVVDKNKDILAPIFQMPSIVGGGEGAIAEHMSKAFQAQLASQAGIRIPLEFEIRLSNSGIVIPDEVPYPCFCKPTGSFDGFKSEMAKCDSREELDAHLRKLRRRKSGRSVLVQEYLDIEREIDIQGFCNDQEIVVPAIINKTHIAQHERGVTLAGVVSPFDELGDTQEKIVTLLQNMHYVGMFDMEINVVAGEYYFNEINLRSGGPNYAFFASGVNLPALFVKTVLGLPIAPEERCVDSFGKHFVYEKVAWEDYSYDLMTKKELNEVLSSADVKLFQNDEDPVPGDLFLKETKEMVEKRRKRLAEKKKKKDTTALATQKPASRGRRRLVWRIKRLLMPYPQYKETNKRNRDAEVPRVMVVGRNYCSNLSLARSFGEAGYEVEVMRLYRVEPGKRDFMRRMKPEAYCKYVRAFYVCVSHRQQAALFEKLMDVGDQYHKMLLVTADDVVASTIDNYYDELKAYYVMPNADNKKGQVNRLMEKGNQKLFAREARLPVLNSCTVRTKNGSVSIPSSVSYPCFIKPNESRASSKSRLTRCNTREELRDALKKFSKKRDVSMLIEDYVDIKREYSILGLAVDGQVVCPGFFGAVQGGEAEHKGVAATGEILSPSKIQWIVKRVKDMIVAMRFEGLFDIDLIETTSGDLYFIEVNFRSGASGYAITAAGANLPGMYADCKLKGLPLDTSVNIGRTGQIFVNDRVLFDEYAKGRITRKEFDEAMASGEIHFVKNDQDPAPYKQFKRYSTLAKLLG